MKIMIFTEGTLIMHSSARDHSREEIVEQVKKWEKSVRDYKNYIPIGNCVEKLKKWTKQGTEIVYLTSRRKRKEIEMVQGVLDRYKFPKGKLLHRKRFEKYSNVAERELPDILIEDDCESIGGEKEMTITFVRPEIKRKIKSIPIKEFGGIDHLPDDASKL
ncbi:MAG: hypothetical protein GF368_00915 [Candidatus Aenigmarchaeota archaeon]|nr:hypothetical protein [Candidatus Aenigmarchaeota archaeon]